MLSMTQEANDYRKRFHRYYYEKIVNDLATFEDARKTTLIKQNIIIGLAIVTLLTEFRCVNFAAILLAGCLIAFALKVSKNFENTLKEGIIQSFLSFFGDFIWSPKKSISEEEIKKSKLVGTINDIVPDDYFEGTHKGLKVVISEAELWHRVGHNNSKMVFNGICVKIDTNKKFLSHTIVTEGNILGKPSEMEQVELEDPEFNKMFKVYTQDQVEARYILTTAFMERFKYLKDVYKTPHIRASFLNNSIIITLDCERDLFKLGNLRKPVTDTGEIQELFEQFVAILSLVDLLHLDSTTGL